MENIPIIKEFKKKFYKENKKIPKQILESEVNLIINVIFFEMEYNKNIMDKLVKHNNFIDEFIYYFNNLT